MDPRTTLPATSLTLEDARRKLSALHFAKEALSDGEREVLYIAEGLMRLIDALPETESPSGGHADSVDLPELRALLAKAGVHAVDVYSDGVEGVGSPNDLDDSAGFITGTYTPEQVRAVAHPSVTVTDRR